MSFTSATQTSCQGEPDESQLGCAYAKTSLHVVYKYTELEVLSNISFFFLLYL